MTDPARQTIDAAVDGVVRATRLRRAVAAGAAGAGAGALLALVAPPAAGLGLAVIASAIGAGWPVDRRSAVVALDGAAGLDGALRCAHDHRDRQTPIAAAQRQRAAQALQVSREGAGRAVRAVAPPAPAWLLGPALWLLPVLMPAEGPPPALPGLDGAAPAAAAAGATLEPAETRPQTTPRDREPRATADPPPPDEAPEPDAGARGDAGPGGAATSTAERGATGQQAGLRPGAGPGRDTAPVEGPGGAPAMVLPVAPGEGAGGDGPAGRVVVGRTPPPPDAIADPARPYPRRYRRAIAAWFDRPTGGARE